MWMLPSPPNPLHKPRSTTHSSHLTKMPSSFTTVLLLLPLLLHYTSTACHVDDESALLSFKSGFTQDPSGVFRSWVPNTDCCFWDGVGCGFTSPNATGRVTRVVLREEFNTRGTYLSGTLSTSLTKLPYLNFVSLTNLPNITGPFPTFLSTIPIMRFLIIENTNLSGRIPRDIGIRFGRLAYLTLRGNQFSGTLPKSLSRLTILTSLDIGGNKLTGPIPPEIGQLRMLNSLNLEKSRFSGSPVKLLSQSTSLVQFIANGNNLRFNISDLVIPETLTNLNLSRNQVYGKVPASIARLEVLDLSHNQLCGQLPNTNFSARAFEGNACLCGSPLPACKN